MAVFEVAESTLHLRLQSQLVQIGISHFWSLRILLKRKQIWIKICVLNVKSCQEFNGDTEIVIKLKAFKWEFSEVQFYKRDFL